MQSSSTERFDCKLNQRDGVLSLTPLVFQRRDVVMGEELGVVVRATQRIDPFGRAAVAPNAAGAGDLAIRDFAQQLVSEGVLDVAGHRRAAGSLNELPSRQAMQKFVSFLPREPTNCLERANPEHLANDGRVLQEPLLDVGEQVQARGDDAVNGLRQLRESAVLQQDPTELLGVQRVAPNAGEQ